MPTKTKNRRAASQARSHIRKRKSRPQPRRKINRGSEASAPKVIANSVFALTVKPKGWAELHDGLKPKETLDGANIVYTDLLKAYNQAADLVGIERFKADKTRTSPMKAVAQLVDLFRKNICPEGFSVNIDEHHNAKLKRIGFHFTVYKPCDFPSEYWHFFDIKNLVQDLYKRNRRLHDFFIIFLRSFIEYNQIPTWYGYQMMDAQYQLADYKRQLVEGFKKHGLSKEVIEMGFTEERIKKRISDIEATMLSYAKGPAAEYAEKIQKTKVRKPAELLRSLKRFSNKIPLVRFMRKGCELMKRTVGINDFCYIAGEAEEEFGMLDNGALGFEMQVSLVWDWSDHYSRTYGNAITYVANNAGAYFPTICARFLPKSTGGLKMSSLTDNLDFPGKISELQGMFQKITEKYTDYETQPELA